jgi:uncharacterized protein DUF3168
MSFEADLRALIMPITTRCYPDVTPDAPVFPLSTYQQVGGEAYAYLEKKLPNHKHARMQITVWSADRIDANRMARLIEKALIESAFTVEAYGAFVALYEPEIKKYGTRQDYGIWYPDP